MREGGSLDHLLWLDGTERLVQVHVVLSPHVGVGVASSDRFHESAAICESGPAGQRQVRQLGALQDGRSVRAEGDAHVLACESDTDEFV